MLQSDTLLGLAGVNNLLENLLNFKKRKSIELLCNYS